MKQFVHKLSVSGKERDKEKIPGDQGKQDCQGWRVAGSSLGLNVCGSLESQTLTSSCPALWHLKWGPWCVIRS